MSGSSEVKLTTSTLSPNKYRALFDKYIEHDFESPEYISEFKDHIYFYYLNRLGIICTTTTMTNELLWAHYSNNNGFALEIDYMNLPPNFQDPVEMNYAKNLDEFTNFKNNDPFQTIFLNSLIKKDIWSYEDEFRIFVSPRNNSNTKIFENPVGFYRNNKETIQKQSRLFRVNKSIFKSIALGFHFFTNHITKSDFDRIDIRFDTSDEQSDLKRRVLEFGVKNKIPFFNTAISKVTFELDSYPIKIKKINSNLFHIYK